jgi:hypothetical protein
MRLALPPFALVFSSPSSSPKAAVNDRPALDQPVDDWSIHAAVAPVKNPRLRIELCTFSVLLFLNFVKYIVLGGALGCG